MTSVIYSFQSLFRVSRLLLQSYFFLGVSHHYVMDLNVRLGGKKTDNRVSHILKKYILTLSILLLVHPMTFIMYLGLKIGAGSIKVLCSLLTAKGDCVSFSLGQSRTDSSNPNGIVSNFSKLKKRGKMMSYKGSN